MNIKLLIVLGMVLTGTLNAQEVIWQLDGLSKPESALYWTEKSQWVVSEIGAGGPSAKTGEGFLSLINADGTRNPEPWIQGLNAPKGLAWFEGHLYVACVDQVVVIDPVSGTLQQTVLIPGSLFLNDTLGVPGLGVLVTDTQTATIWLIEKGAARPYVQGSQLGYPNGLAFDGETLLLAQFGGAKGSGQLLSSSFKTPSVFQPLGNFKGGLDGIVVLGPEDYLVSDYNSGKIWRIIKGEAQLFWTGKKSTADLGWSPERREILVPSLDRGTLHLIRVSP